MQEPPKINPHVWHRPEPKGRVLPFWFYAIIAVGFAAATVISILLELDLMHLRSLPRRSERLWTWLHQKGLIWASALVFGVTAFYYTRKSIRTFRAYGHKLFLKRKD